MHSRKRAKKKPKVHIFVISAAFAFQKLLKQILHAFDIDRFFLVCGKCSY